MTSYRIYQRDPITGHMNIIAELECESEREATLRSREYLASADILLCEGTRVVHFCRPETTIGFSG